MSLDEMRHSPDTYLVKTHDDPGNDRFIMLHRDGRDCVVSYAKALTRDCPDKYDGKLQDLCNGDFCPPWGDWGHVISQQLKKDTTRLGMLRYEDLHSNPMNIALHTLNSVGVECHIKPGFDPAEAKNNPGFRRGTVGSHKDEMPDKQFVTFMTRNRQQMGTLGYV